MINMETKCFDNVNKGIRFKFIFFLLKYSEEEKLSIQIKTVIF